MQKHVRLLAMIVQKELWLHAHLVIVITRLPVLLELIKLLKVHGVAPDYKTEVTKITLKAIGTSLPGGGACLRRQRTPPLAGGTKAWGVSSPPPSRVYKGLGGPEPPPLGGCTRRWGVAARPCLGFSLRIVAHAPLKVCNSASCL